MHSQPSNQPKPDKIKNSDDLFDRLLNFVNGKESGKTVTVESLQQKELLTKVYAYNSFISKSKQKEKEKLALMFSSALRKQSEQEWKNFMKNDPLLQDLLHKDNKDIWNMITKVRQLNLQEMKIEQLLNTPNQAKSFQKIKEIEEKVKYYQSIIKYMIKIPEPENTIIPNVDTNRVDKNMLSKQTQDMLSFKKIINELITQLAPFRDKQDFKNIPLICSKQRFFLLDPVKNLINKVNAQEMKKYSNQQYSTLEDQYQFVSSTLHNLSQNQFSINKIKIDQIRLEQKQVNSLLTIAQQLQESYKKSCQICNFMRQQATNIITKSINTDNNKIVLTNHTIYQNLQQIQNNVRSLIEKDRQDINRKDSSINLNLSQNQNSTTAVVISSKFERKNKNSEVIKLNQLQNFLQQIDSILGLEKRQMQSIKVQQINEKIIRNAAQQIRRLKSAEKNYQQRLKKQQQSNNGNDNGQKNTKDFSQEKSGWNILKGNFSNSLKYFIPAPTIKQNNANKNISQVRQEQLKTNWTLVLTQNEQFKNTIKEHQNQIKQLKQLNKTNNQQIQNNKKHHQQIVSNMIKNYEQQYKNILNAIKIINNIFGNSLRQGLIHEGTIVLDMLANLKNKVEVLHKQLEEEVAQRKYKFSENQRLLYEINNLKTLNSNTEKQLQSLQEQNIINQANILQHKRDIQDKNQQILQAFAIITKIKLSLKETEQKLKQCQAKYDLINEQLTKSQIRVVSFEKSIEQLERKQLCLDKIVKNQQLRILEKNQQIQAIQQRYQITILGLKEQLLKLRFLETFERKSCIYENKPIEAAVKRAISEIQIQNNKKLGNTSLLFRYSPLSKPIQNEFQGKCHNLIVIKFPQGKCIIAYVSIPLHKSKTTTITQQRRGFIILENQQKSYFCALKKQKQAVQYNNFGHITLGKSDLRLQFGTKGKMYSNIGYINSCFDSQNKKMKQMFGANEEFFEEMEIHQLHFCEPDYEILQKQGSTAGQKTKSNDYRISQAEIIREQLKNKLTNEEQHQTNILQKQISIKYNKNHQLITQPLDKLSNIQNQLENMKQILKLKSEQENKLLERIKQKDQYIQSLFDQIEKLGKKSQKQSEKCQIINKKYIETNQKAGIVAKHYQQLQSFTQEQQNIIIKLRAEVQSMLESKGNRQNQQQQRQQQNRLKNISQKQLIKRNQKLIEELQNQRAKIKQSKMNYNQLESLKTINQNLTLQLSQQSQKLQILEKNTELMKKLLKQQSEKCLMIEEEKIKMDSRSLITINKLQSEVESISKRINDRETESNQQQIKMNKLQKLMTQQNAENYKLKEQIKHLKAQSREFELKCSEIEYLKAQNQSLALKFAEKNQKQINYYKQQLERQIEQRKMIEKQRIDAVNSVRNSLSPSNLIQKSPIKRLQPEMNKTASSKNKITSKIVNEEQIRKQIRQQLQKMVFQSYQKKLSSFQRQEYKLIENSNFETYDPLRLMYLSQLFQGDLLQLLPLYKYNICYHLQKLHKQPIIRTRLIYKYDIKNKTNFHEYIDNQSHLLLIAKTVDDAYIVGYYSGRYGQTLMTDPGMLISLHNNEAFQLNTHDNNIGNQRQGTYKAMQYDKYYATFGNAEIRIKTGESKVFSNFGIMNSYYNHRQKKVSEFLKNDNKRQVELESYEFYQVIFEVTHQQEQKSHEMNQQRRRQQ